MVEQENVNINVLLNLVKQLQSSQALIYDYAHNKYKFRIFQ